MSDKSHLFDSLVAQTEAPDCPKGGYQYLYTWSSDDSRKNSWRVDGYRWRQNGICKANKQSNVTKTYFHVSVSLLLINIYYFIHWLLWCLIIIALYCVHSLRIV